MTDEAPATLVGPERLYDLLRRDLHAMECLRVARDFGPKGAYLAAGFVRNRYWDSLYPKNNKDFEHQKSDIDVVYFDPNNISREHETGYESALKEQLSGEDWQVRNQARMHDFAGHAPFHNMAHALEHWSETATAIGVRIDEAENLHLIAPFGLSDLYVHCLRVSPIVARHDPNAFWHRLNRKQWRQRWPKIKIVGSELA